MDIEKRSSEVRIVHWTRVINGTKYRFTATYWTDTNQARFAVEQRSCNAHKHGYLYIHDWTVTPGGNIIGIFRRS